MKAITLIVGSGLIGTGLVVAAGDIFLWSWEQEALGATDIMARGPFLLGLFLPYFLLGSAIITAGMVAYVGRRTEISFGRRTVMATLAVCLGFAAVYLEPTSTFFRSRNALPGGEGLLLKAAVDITLVGFGGLLLRKSALTNAAAT